MSDFDVKVRNLETGETMVASMPDCEACIRWLSARPANLEILGVLSTTSVTERDRLQAAMRPYDTGELALKRKFDETRLAAAQQAYAEELERIQAEASGPQGVSGGDSARPMTLHWDIDTGLALHHDDREITPVVREAVDAWVAERNGWVESRGQLVVDADIEVWPAEVPADETRVREGGRFHVRLKVG